MCNFRQPLKAGTPIKMRSGAEYKINELIGCGGLSLVYSTIEANGLSTKIIKEFFPAPSEQVGVYAVRNKQGKVCPKNSSCQKFFEDARCRFDDEGIIGQRVAEEISQVIPFWEYYDGYAVMTRESRDMLSIELLTDRWEKIHPIPDGEENIDPVFDDIPRLKYSLSVIESLLVALSVIHKNYLHLDLSVTNILWACSEIETGIGGHIIITDFGSSACLDINGVVRPNYSLYSSKGFAAPEMFDNPCVLTVKTDLFAVGMLLIYLCAGKDVFERQFNKLMQNEKMRPDEIERRLDNIFLKIPVDFHRDLNKILTKALISREYTSAKKMCDDISQLKRDIPIGPINRCDTKSFTLYSLKSMLEGSRTAGYSWAHELRARRSIDDPSVADVSLPEEVCEAVYDRQFNDNNAFLESVLPEGTIKTLILENKQFTIQDIMNGKYDSSLRSELRNSLSSYITMNMLLTISDSLLHNCHKEILTKDISALWSVLGEQGEFLYECCVECRFKQPTSYQVSRFAMLIAFALIGADEFKRLIGNPQKAPCVFTIRY